MLVGIQLFVPGLYFPPVFKPVLLAASPPQTIISVPVHIAVCEYRALGAFVVLVDVQMFVAGWYLPPVFSTWLTPSSKWPPHTIISLPVHTAVCESRPCGELALLVAAQVSVL